MSFTLIPTIQSKGYDSTVASGFQNRHGSTQLACHARMMLDWPVREFAEGRQRKSPVKKLQGLSSLWHVLPVPISLPESGRASPVEHGDTLRCIFE